MVKTVPEEEGPRVRVETLATRLSLESHRDALSGIETLSNRANVVQICPGMTTIRINDGIFQLGQPVLASSRGVLVPAEAETLIRTRLRTPPPDPPERRPKKTPERRPPATSWAGIETPPIPRSWKVAANRTWDSIVIHHSATERGGARLFDKMHREKNGWEYGLGYHFVIGNGTDTGDGEVEVGSRWIRQNEGIHGAHAGSDHFNQYGIGICLVGNFEEDRPTGKQMAALLKLVRRLASTYRIPTSRIFDHQKVRPEHTDCPGRFFPMSRFRAAVRRPR